MSCWKKIREIAYPTDWERLLKGKKWNEWKVEQRSKSGTETLTIKISFQLHAFPRMFQCFQFENCPFCSSHFRHRKNFGPILTINFQLHFLPSGREEHWYTVVLAGMFKASPRQRKPRFSSKISSKGLCRGPLFVSWPGHRIYTNRSAIEYIETCELPGVSLALLRYKYPVFLMLKHKFFSIFIWSQS